MDYHIIFNQVVILFIIMVIGFIGAKVNIIDETLIKGLSNLLINIALPLLILSSFEIAFSSEMASNAIIVVVITFIILFFSILLSKILFYKYESKEKQVSKFITIFSNCGFMGFPIVASIYGKEGLFYTSIYNIPVTILIWTYGVYLFSEKKDIKSIKKVLINPAIIATFIGILFFLFSIKLPSPIKGTIEMVGSITVPVSMLVIGASLSNVKFMEIMKSFKIYFVSLIRLLLIPIIVIITLSPFHLSNVMIGSIVILTGMPAATSSAIIGELYGGDTELASKIVFMSTILSAFTIPFIILLL